MLVRELSPRLIGLVSKVDQNLFCVFFELVLQVWGEMLFPIPGHSFPDEAVGILFSPGSPSTHALEAVPLDDVFKRRRRGVE